MLNGSPSLNSDINYDVLNNKINKFLCTYKHETGVQTAAVAQSLGILSDLIAWQEIRYDTDPTVIKTAKEAMLPFTGHDGKSGD